MRDLALANVDLNLLVVFDTIAAERSVSRAAERLHLTQSAVSHALGRLRALTGDRLFVRTPRGMEPTPYAAAITGQVGAVLSNIKTILLPEGKFEPSRSTQRFILGMTDYMAYLIAPVLARRLREAAPGVRIIFLPSNVRAARSQIESGAIDLYVGNPLPDMTAYISSTPLFNQPSACVARADHPAFAGPLTKHSFLAHAHLHISPWGEPGFIDDMLARHGSYRRIGMTVGDFMIVPAILEQSDLIATLPQRIATPMMNRYGLAMQQPPFDFGAAPIALTWHARFDNDPAYDWVRGEIAQAATP